MVKVFDGDLNKVGKRIGEFVISDASDIAKELRGTGIKIAMLCVPASAAQEVADKLVAAGVKAILNYAPISLNVPKSVKVQYLDPAIGLQRMTYYL